MHVSQATRHGAPASRLFATIDLASVKGIDLPPTGRGGAHGTAANRGSQGATAFFFFFLDRGDVGRDERTPHVGNEKWNKFTSESASWEICNLDPRPASPPLTAPTTAPLTPSTPCTSSTAASPCTSVVHSTAGTTVGEPSAASPEVSPPASTPTAASTPPSRFLSPYHTPHSLPS